MRSHRIFGWIAAWMRKSSKRRRFPDSRHGGGPRQRLAGVCSDTTHGPQPVARPTGLQVGFPDGASVVPEPEDIGDGILRAGHQ